MKKLYIIFVIICAGFFLGSCSEDIFNSVKVEEGVPVTLSLTYKDIAPTEVTVTRAGRTDDEEKRLKDLQVFIFSANGNHNLKGYAHIVDKNGTQNILEQHGNIGDVKVKTTSGDSYIYAIANYTTDNYDVKGLPDNLNENDAQNGDISFNLEDFKKLAFERKAGVIEIGDGWFLMSGTVQDGGICTISTNGGISGDNVIKLRRVVSKVKFDIVPSYTAADGSIISFDFVNYDIHNIPTVGNLIKGANLNDVNDFDRNDYQAMNGISPDKQQDYNGFIIYLPENTQTAKRELNENDGWAQREADGDAVKKEFTNAPDNGTYIVLHGTYNEMDKSGNLKKSGTTDYTIHLGDFTRNVNDYNNERNYKYTYNIKVTGVNSIKAEATKENPEEQTAQPGAEGVIFEYDKGKQFTLDSHFEYCVMQFNREDISKLKKDGLGYCFRVKGLTSNGTMGETQTIIVTDGSVDTYNNALNGVDISWIKFLKGGTYSSTNSKGGQDTGYKKLYDNNYGDALGAIELLKLLYDKADDNSSGFWDASGNITFTCYVNENFYNNHHWRTFVNLPDRVFYIANSISVSKDERSKYAKVAYGISQHSIQTFYNRDQNKHIDAFGCETIDETSGLNLKGNYDDGKADNTYSSWNGRDNMIKDLNISDGTTNWSDYDNIRTLTAACMKRNRDLNHNGKIDADEILWYTPTVEQYTGLWMGEEALAKSAVLYSGDLSKFKDEKDYKNYGIHYYTSTKGHRTFWSEEGMAVGNYNDPVYYFDPEKGETVTRHIRCIRTLPNQTGLEDLGASTEPAKYYKYENNIFDLSNMDQTATNVQTSELAWHGERSTLNKVAPKFEVDTQNIEVNKLGTKLPAQRVVDGELTCENLKGKDWRVPNQREFALMFLNIKLPDYVFCRTHFSNTDYRSTWSTENGNMYMLNPFNGLKSPQNGYLRCIKVNP